MFMTIKNIVRRKRKKQRETYIQYFLSEFQTYLQWHTLLSYFSLKNLLYLHNILFSFFQKRTKKIFAEGYDTKIYILCANVPLSCITYLPTTKGGGNCGSGK